MGVLGRERLRRRTNTSGRVGPFDYDGRVTSRATQTDGSLTCVECAYDLVGLPQEGVCPECGKPVLHSTRRGLLRHEPISWLDPVVRGASLRLHAVRVGLFAVLAGVALVAVAVVLDALGVAIASPEVERSVGNVFAMTVIGVIAVAAAWYARGIWLITTPKADGSSVLRSVRQPTGWLALAAVGLGGFSPFTEWLALSPTAALAVDGAILVTLCAHVWTFGRVCEILSDRVQSLPQASRRRLRLARRDAWVILTVAGPPLAIFGVNLSAIAMLAYIVSVQGSMGALTRAIRLEREIASATQDLPIEGGVQEGSP